MSPSSSVTTEKDPVLFDAKCPLCRLALSRSDFPNALKTPLLFQDDRVIVVVDLDAKGFQERLLAVTKLGHIPCGCLDPVNSLYMQKVLEKCAKNRWGEEAKTRLDLHSHSIVTHEHYQIGLVVDK